jgi:hypothetical protein
VNQTPLLALAVVVGLSLFRSVAGQVPTSFAQGDSQLRCLFWATRVGIDPANATAECQALVAASKDGELSVDDCMYVTVVVIGVTDVQKADQACDALLSHPDPASASAPTGVSAPATQPPSQTTQSLSLVTAAPKPPAQPAVSGSTSTQASGPSWIEELMAQIRQTHIDVHGQPVDPADEASFRGCLVRNEAQGRTRALFTCQREIFGGTTTGD